uniref:Uncharacterized protein n=1 Tax=Anopheles farauti TaxID=69004 RepID=A0A182QY83_9DIPT
MVVVVVVVVVVFSQPRLRTFVLVPAPLVLVGVVAEDASVALVLPPTTPVDSSVEPIDVWRSVARGGVGGDALGSFRAVPGLPTAGTDWADCSRDNESQFFTLLVRESRLARAGCGDAVCGGGTGGGGGNRADDFLPPAGDVGGGAAPPPAFTTGIEEDRSRSSDGVSLLVRQLRAELARYRLPALLLAVLLGVVVVVVVVMVRTRLLLVEPGADGGGGACWNDDDSCPNEPVSADFTYKLPVLFVRLLFDGGPDETTLVEAARCVGEGVAEKLRPVGGFVGNWGGE